MGEMSIDQISEKKELNTKKKKKKASNNCSVNFNDYREMYKSEPIKLATTILQTQHTPDLDLNGKFFELLWRKCKRKKFK